MIKIDKWPSTESQDRLTAVCETCLIVELIAFMSKMLNIIFEVNCQFNLIPNPEKGCKQTLKFVKLLR